ncbi:MAG: transaldolase [Deltaproteobacteria bacterium]|nr:transaldolase [Deltaproteobacteria bacterium]
MSADVSKLRIKIFADGADRSSLLKLANDSLISGLTTNPSLMRKAGVADYRAFCRDILQHIQEKPISFEVLADDFEEMRRQALTLLGMGENVYVKIPITNCERQSSVPLIHELAHKGVKINVTAMLTLGQVVQACDALKGGASSIISVFAGRIADTGTDPVPIMRAASEICKAADSKIELLWASSRELYNVVEAEQAGCDIITMTTDLLKKLPQLGKNLEQLSLETVQMFKRDADAAGYTL